MGRLRDCAWTKSDYYWLCQRKLSQLPPSEKAAFAEAPLIMEFRKERDDPDDQHDSCDAYNRRKLHALATDNDRPVAKFAAAYTGVDHRTARASTTSSSPGCRTRSSSARARP